MALQTKTTALIGVLQTRFCQGLPWVERKGEGEASLKKELEREVVALGDQDNLEDYDWVKSKNQELSLGLCVGLAEEKYKAPQAVEPG